MIHLTYMSGSLWKEHSPIDGGQVQHVPMPQSDAPDSLRLATGDLILLTLLLI